ncbi:MAG: hypothetical protein ACLGPL_02660, partial [Acidobacteriota bacterium]
LGIPAIFISNTGRGYTTEQDRRYGLIKHYGIPEWDRIVDRLHSWASRDLFDEWQEKRRGMLKEKIEVTSWLVDLVERYPESMAEARSGHFERFAIRCAE